MDNFIKPEIGCQIEVTTLAGGSTIHLEADLVKIEVLTSVALPYQTFLLTFFTNNKNIISNEIYGEDPISISFTILNVQGQPTFASKFDLTIIDLKTQIVPSKNITDIIDQPDRSNVQLTCVPTKALKIMTSLVNNVYIDTKLSDIISDVISKSGGISKIDVKEINPLKPHNVCIPPMTLYRVIRGYSEKQTINNGYSGYIDSLFGICNGVPICWCDWEGNVYLKNLNSEIKKEPQFTIYQLASGTNTDKIENDSVTGKVLYSTLPIKWKTKQNQKIVRLGNQINFVDYPLNKLVEQNTYKIDEVATNNSCMSKKYDMTFKNKSLSNRTTVMEFPINYDGDKTTGTSYIARNIANLSELEFTIQRFVKLKKLQNVGCSVLFKPKVMDYMPLAGTYILKSVKSIFINQQGWRRLGVLTLMRTNISE